MKYNVWFRGDATQKMNKLKGVTHEQLLQAVGALLETRRKLRLKIEVAENG